MIAPENDCFCEAISEELTMNHCYHCFIPFGPQVWRDDSRFCSESCSRQYRKLSMEEQLQLKYMRLRSMRVRAR